MFIRIWKLHLCTLVLLVLTGLCLSCYFLLHLTSKNYVLIVVGRENRQFTLVKLPIFVIVIAGARMSFLKKCKYLFS
jgi:hypothetical protein